MSPRKVRLVGRVLKGMDVNRAKYQLDHLAKRPSKPLAKLLESAIANARSGFQLPRENLFVKDIVVNEGSKLKRWRAKGFGSASPIEKKTSHIRIVLEEKIPGLKSEIRNPKPSTRAEHGAGPVPHRNEVSGAGFEKISKPEKAEIPEKETETKKETKEARPEVKKKIGRKGVFGDIKGLGKRFFRRKAI